MGHIGDMMGDEPAMAAPRYRAGARRRRIGEISILREARVSQTKVGDGTDRQQQIVALSDLWRARMPTLHPARALRLHVSNVGCGATPEAPDCRHGLPLSADSGRSQTSDRTAGVDPKPSMGRTVLIRFPEAAIRAGTDFRPKQNREVIDAGLCYPQTAKSLRERA